MLPKIVFWEPTVSPHKDDFFNEIANHNGGGKVIVVADSDISADRKKMGWTVEESQKYTLIINPSVDAVNKIVCDNKDALHVFSGIRHFKTIVNGLRAVKKIGAKFCVMSEPRVNDGFKGVCRYVQSALTEKWLKENVQAVFAIGRNGPPWFRRVGYDENKIVPFGYFINPREDQSHDAIYRENNCIKVGYVGRLVPQKGVVNLINALGLVDNAVLEVVGSGELEANIKKLAKKNGILLKMHGVMPIKKIQDFMATLDILVLPSVTKDGWGVVVNEALMQGTAVIASNCVGASILMDNDLFGRVVRPNNPNEIAAAIVDLEKTKSLEIISRNKRKYFAKKILTAEAGAEYFVGVLKNIYMNNILVTKTFFNIE